MYFFGGKSFFVFNCNFASYIKKNSSTKNQEKFLIIFFSDIGFEALDYFFITLFLYIKNVDFFNSDVNIHLQEILIEKQME